MLGKTHFCTFDFKAQMLLANEASYFSGTENEDRPSDKDWGHQSHCSPKGKKNEARRGMCLRTMT